MAESELFLKLNYLKAYRKSRLEAAHFVLANPELFPELLEYCGKVDDDISYKAAWVLEFVCNENLELIYPQLDTFCDIISEVKKEQALRAMAKICSLVTEEYYKKRSVPSLKYFHGNHAIKMSETCFDWMITNRKVACQVHAMQTLFYVGKEIKWIYPELNVILHENIHHQSAAYKARAKKILALGLK